MSQLPLALQKLIRSFSRLPSIGEKSATRLAYHLVTKEKELAQSLAAALTEAIEQVRLCDRCFGITDQKRCRICADPLRDERILCVVEKPMDIVAIERVGEFRGLYHVLHGLWAPLKGAGPSSLMLEPLLERVTQEQVEEVILATSSTLEGDATSLYIAQLLQPRNVRCSRLAQGMPKGGELEFTDELTLSRAFAGRSSL